MRTYMKPVMESEAFVANEFVSACFYFDCTGCNTLDGYSQGEAFSHMDVKRSAQYVAAANIATQHGGIIGDNYSDTNGTYVVFNDVACCDDGCYTKTEDVEWWYYLLMNFLSLITGNGFWTPDVSTTAHHHIVGRPTNKSDRRPNFS